MLARWRGGQDLEADLSAFTHIILYDADATSWGDASEKLEAAYSTLRGKGLTPVCVAGGFSAIQTRLPYMLTSKVRVIQSETSKGRAIQNRLPYMVTSKVRVSETFKWRVTLAGERTYGLV